MNRDLTSGRTFDVFVPAHVAPHMSVVLEGSSSSISTRRPRGAPIPRAMRGNDVILPVPHPPECVDPTGRPRGARNNYPTRVLSRTYPRVTLGPRVYCPAPTRTRE